MTRFFLVIALVASSSVASAQGVSVTLAEWKLGLSRDTVQAGPVTFRVTNEGSMNHAFYVRGTGVAKGTREIAKGESASLTVTLVPGTYDLYCPLADGTHKQAGLAKTLVVIPAKKPGA
jgi:uncharacterized cupredoxin-like copper-binding protein